MFQGRPLRAHIPPHHIWGIPNQSQHLSFKLYLHGTPMEIFSTQCPIDEAEKMEKQFIIQQRELTMISHDPNDKIVLPPIPIYASSRMSLWLPTTDTQTCKIGMAHKRGLSLDEDLTLSKFASLCGRSVYNNISSNTSVKPFCLIHQVLYRSCVSCPFQIEQFIAIIARYEYVSRV